MIHQQLEKKASIFSMNAPSAMILKLQLQVSRTTSKNGEKCIISKAFVSIHISVLQNGEINYNHG